MNRVDYGVVDHRRIDADLNDARSDVISVYRERTRVRGRSVEPARQEPERARTGKGHEAADGCVFRRNMGLFPFATRFTRASQLAFVASPPTNDLTPHLVALDHARAHTVRPFLPALSFRTTVLAWMSRNTK